MIRLKEIINTLIFISACLTATAQNESTRAAQYINQYKQLAIEEMYRTGIPASITLAQGILETGGGQSDLASQANNHFGIKCKAEWTGETILHDDDAKNECFRKYPNVEASYRDHSEFLRTRPNYAFLFKLEPTDYEGWAKGLKKAGYATNPSYPQRLMKIIVENNLQEITLLALRKKDQKEANLFAFESTDKDAVEDNWAAADESVSIVTQASISTTDHQNTAAPKYAPKTASRYPLNQVFTINEARVIYTTAGTSLLALANNYNISYKKLLEFNDLNEIDIVNSDQLIFLQKKQKRGTKEIHVVEANESLHDICQKEGIQMESLLTFNRLQKGMQPAKGENLYLKSPAPASPKLATNKHPYAENSMR